MTTQSSTIHLETEIQRTDKIVSSNMGDEVVMMSLENNAYYGLDGVGSHIWHLLDAPTTPAAICDQLIGQFDVSPAACRQDVLSFLDELLTHDLVQIVA